MKREVTKAVAKSSTELQVHISNKVWGLTKKLIDLIHEVACKGDDEINFVESNYDFFPGDPGYV